MANSSFWQIISGTFNFFGWITHDADVNILFT